MWTYTSTQYLLCGALTHKVDKCWHVKGVPDHVKERLAGFQTLFRNKAPPYENAALNIAAISSTTTVNDTSDSKEVTFGSVVPSAQGHIEEAKEDALYTAGTAKLSKDAYRSNFLSRQGNVSAMNLSVDDMMQDTSIVNEEQHLFLYIGGLSG